jgi:hypothetical protein
LHNAEFHNLSSSPNIIRITKSRRMRWAGHVAHMGERRDAYNALVGNSKGSIPLGVHRSRLGNNIVAYIVTRHGVWTGDWI